MTRMGMGLSELTGVLRVTPWTGFDSSANSLKTT